MWSVFPRFKIIFSILNQPLFFMLRKVFISSTTILLLFFFFFFRKSLISFASFVACLSFFVTSSRLLFTIFYMLKTIIYIKKIFSSELLKLFQTFDLNFFYNLQNLEIHHIISLKIHITHHIFETYYNKLG